MSQVRIAVAVPGPFYSPLTYLAPRSIAPGSRVRVPLGPRQVVGIVLDAPVDDSLPADRLKSIITVLDAQPALTPEQLALGAWLCRYYHAPAGEVYFMLLPKALRTGQGLWKEGEPAWTLTEAGRAVAVDRLPPRAVRQRRLLQWFKAQETARLSALRTFMPDYREPLRRFVQQGWVKAFQLPCLPDRPLPPPQRHTLNDDQRRIVAAVALDRFNPHLIEGVTGSGKTAVYLALVERVIAAGRQALVLVPEIGLTPQMIECFEAWLQQPVVALHSGLNESERHCGWSRLARGQARVALGTRSALLGRFHDLGLIVVDEEHDPAYKQQEGVRYSARDTALWLGRQLQIPVVLGSATPSLESLHHAQTGRYQHHLLRQRAGTAQLPSLKLVDIRGEHIEAGVSAPLRAAMQAHLQQGRQVLLFLNRRGFAPVLMCHHCGWQADCPACSAHLTYHQTPEHLHCHHCDYQRPVPQRCPGCGSGSFVQVGQGTARLEAALAQQFDVPVVRIDRDSTRRKGVLAARLAQVHQGDPLILVGTQMLAKGHHFPLVTLVGMLEVDQALFSPDFRAPERLAQQIVQVAGRAGRGKQPGEVLIETRQPEHPLLQTLVNGGYGAFAQTALAERAAAQLPPYSHQVLIRASSPKAEAAQAFLTAVAAQCQQAEVEVWGPVSAPMVKRQGQWRYQLLLQSLRRAPLHQLLDRLLPWLWAQRSHRVRWSIDVDPQEMG